MSLSQSEPVVTRPPRSKGQDIEATLVETSVFRSLAYCGMGPEGYRCGHKPGRKAKGSKSRIAGQRSLVSQREAAPRAAKIEMRDPSGGEQALRVIP